MQYLGPVGAQSLRRQKCRHDRRPATGMAAALDQRLGQSLDIEAFHQLDHHFVVAHDFVVVIEVGKVGAGHDEGFFPTQHFGQSRAQFAAGRHATCAAQRLAHHHRQKRERSQNILEEGKLDLQ